MLLAEKKVVVARFVPRNEGADIDRPRKLYNVSIKGFSDQLSPSLVGGIPFSDENMRFVERNEIFVDHLTIFRCYFCSIRGRDVWSSDGWNERSNRTRSLLVSCFMPIEKSIYWKKDEVTSIQVRNDTFRSSDSTTRTDKITIRKSKSRLPNAVSVWDQLARSTAYQDFSNFRLVGRFVKTSLKVSPSSDFRRSVKVFD